MLKNYDIVIIGCGPGGFAAAMEASKLNKTVAVIEKKQIGGTCLNSGCIPTKALLHAANLYNDAKNGHIFGIFHGDVSYSLDDIMKYADETKNLLRDGMISQLKRANIDIIYGKAYINKDKSIAIFNGDIPETISAENIIIATGAIPSLPKIPGIDLKNVITSEDILNGNFDKFKSLTIIGGGVIGVEFAEALSKLDMKISIIECSENLLPNMDIEISRSVKSMLQKRGIEIFTGAKVCKIEQSDRSLNCISHHKNNEQNSIISDSILVATGRVSSLDNLFSDDLNIASENSKIIVDKNFETSEKHIYAIGDVIKGLQLAHLASAQAICCVRSIFNQEINIDLAAIPLCVYTSPEIASVGLSADQAKNLGISIKTAKALTSANGKSQIVKSERGFIKMIFDASTQEILGAQMLCPHSSDMIGEFSSAIINKLTYAQLSKAIRPHPSFNEIVFEALR